jgi:hypothetical protein
MWRCVMDVYMRCPICMYFWAYCSAGVAALYVPQVPFLSREREAASGQAVVLPVVCVHALSDF